MQALFRYPLRQGEAVPMQAPQPHKEDVRQHLQQLRRQVLRGVHLVFSHVIPLEQDMTQHPLWRLATQVTLHWRPIWTGSMWTHNKTHSVDCGTWPACLPKHRLRFAVLGT